MHLVPTYIVHTYIASVYVLATSYVEIRDRVSESRGRVSNFSKSQARSGMLPVGMSKDADGDGVADV
jgi:hypothetical protein